MVNPVVSRSVDDPLPTSSRAPLLYLIAVSALSVVLLGCVVASFVLSHSEQAVPDVISLIAGSAGTSLGALLVRERSA